MTREQLVQPATGMNPIWQRICLLGYYDTRTTGVRHSFLCLWMLEEMWLAFQFSPNFITVPGDMSKVPMGGRNVLTSSSALFKHCTLFERCLENPSDPRPLTLVWHAQGKAWTVNRDGSKLMVAIAIVAFLTFLPLYDPARLNELNMKSLARSPNLSPVPSRLCFYLWPAYDWAGNQTVNKWVISRLCVSVHAGLSNC